MAPIVNGLTIKDGDVSKKVYPSGKDPATYCVPILAPAPGLFSTKTLCFRIPDKLWAKIRAAISVDPPGANATTKRMGLFG